jgi:glutaredoxin
VTLYLADGCHLCEQALTQLEQLRLELDFELEPIDIEGDPELEREYRALLPVVELDGERASILELDIDDLRDRLG